MYAYCFYNENGAFLIYYALQRNEWYFYTSDRYSTNQVELLKVDISDEVFSMLRHAKVLCFSEISKLSFILKRQLKTSPILFGIPLS